MKCDKYKELINKLVEEKLSFSESEILIEHTEQCEVCRQDYSAALSYKIITSNLKRTEPALENKGAFIDKIFNELPDVEETTESSKIIKHWFVESRFRRVIASVAAALVMFFIIQQTHDAWLVKQLETKVAQKYIPIDYDKIREQSVLKIITEYENKNEDQLLLSKYKALLFKKTFTKLSRGNRYVHLRLSSSFLK